MDSAATVDLLWECARPEPRPERVSAAVAAGAPLERVTELAVRHGIGPLAAAALAAAHVDTDGCGALTREVALRRAQARMVLPTAVALAVTPMMEAGIEPVVWKGPALAVRYRDPALRPMADIDVIVPADRHDEATDALRKGGWRVVPPHRGDHYDTALVHPSAPGIPVELHFGLADWRHRANGLRSDELWSRRVPIELFGLQAFGLAPDDEIVALAAHAAKPYHTFGRLIWVTDLAVAAAGLPEEAWPAVRARAAAADCRIGVAVGLRLAARVGATVPAAAQDLPASGARRRALDPVLDPAWPLAEDWHRDRFRLRYALIDRNRRVAAVWLGDLLDEPAGQRLRRAWSDVTRAAGSWRRLRRRPQAT